MAVAKKIKTEDILPNPHRNFEIDPIDPEHVNELANSYDELKDFSTLTARPFGNKYQLACGHHRLEAMKQLGYKEVDVKIMDLDELNMTRVMARENMTQRGTRPSAIQDAVAASTEYIAEELLRYNDYARFAELSDVGTFVQGLKAWQTTRGMINKGEGLGLDLIHNFTGEIVGKRAIKEAIGSLKANGEVLTIINRVVDKLDREAEEQEARLQQEAEEAEALRIVEEEEAIRIAEEEEAEAQRVAKEEEEQALKAAKDEEARKKARKTKKKADAKAKKKAEAKRKAAEAAKEKAKIEAEAKAKKQKAINKKAAEDRKKAQQAAKEKLAKKIEPDALRLFTKSGHQDTFRKLLLDNIDLFAKDQQVNLADAIIRWCKVKNPNNKVTTEYINKAFSKMERDGKIWTKEMQAEEKTRMDMLRKQDESKVIENKIIRIEGDMRNYSRKMEKAVTEYTKLLTEEPTTKDMLNVLTYNQDIRSMSNALLILGKMLGDKLNYLVDDVVEV